MAANTGEIPNGAARGYIQHYNPAGLAQIERQTSKQQPIQAAKSSTLKTLSIALPKESAYFQCVSVTQIIGQYIL